MKDIFKDWWLRFRRFSITKKLWYLSLIIVIWTS